MEDYKRKEDGTFAEGNKGRKEGSKNKFTKVKEEIVSLWEDSNLKDKLILQLKLYPEKAPAMVKDLIIPLLRETGIKIDQSQTVQNITIGWKTSADSQNKREETEDLQRM